jgi:hypothetical protein
LRRATPFTHHDDRPGARPEHNRAPRTADGAELGAAPSDAHKTRLLSVTRYVPLAATLIVSVATSVGSVQGDAGRAVSMIVQAAEPSPCDTTPTSSPCGYRVRWRAAHLAFARQARMVADVPLEHPTASIIAASKVPPSRTEHILAQPRSVEAPAIGRALRSGRWDRPVRRSRRSQRGGPPKRMTLPSGSTCRPSRLP